MPQEKFIQVDTVILSDIHLGLSQSRALALVAALKSYRFKRLILNGDIFDDMNFGRLNSDHWEVVSYIRHVSKFSEVIWIIGNHDGRALFLSRLLGVKVYDFFEWQEGRVKCLAIHGHQYDRFISKNLFISNLAGWVYYWLRDIEHSNQFMTDLIKRYSRSWLRLSDEVAKGALRLAKEKGAHFVFCGHTHLPLKMSHKGIEYINSGSWVESPSSMIIIDKGKPELIRFS
ncbi:MAG: metallophosphoesterase [Candidatus Falkowbacteria bacterium]